MQTAKKDTRSFMEIWSCLDRIDRQRIMRSLALEGVTYSYCTVYNWGHGKARPAMYAVRKVVASIVSNVLGINTDADTLFPE